MAKGKLITIEAGDGSGKATQTRALMEHLVKDGYRVVKVEYPDYKSDSSALVKMYLGGEFGEHAEDVDAYGASTFFAVDRYASFHLNWKQAYEEGAIILADRYTTSNMVHQAVKLTDPIEREEFLTWLWDFEFGKLKLPVPDVVVYLDMDPEVSDRLINERAAHNADRKKDIHEKDTNYLHRCHDAYNWVAAKYGWKKVVCSKDGQPRSIEEIHKDVYSAVRRYL
ncbi:dTMP kinase [Anaerovibrio lipolyticus DSM 3074]|uniref:Thymidylate kinase n=1 Tax=Anaerovibrio lipolyticus DSM 3074 TaxID=1120997 RepID=A0A1M6EFX4_9FIRM|nr:deoxynucleoside kinase [Anaerovibrio lipolyticus]SHI84323.1 dTMP kinase [Anaerovibrio lipolyticus DSM 3074]